MTIPIFAHHAHVYPKNERPEGSCDALLYVMDKCGIEKCVVFAPMPHRTSVQNPNQWLSSQLRMHKDRLYGFGVVDIHADNIEEQILEIKDIGLIGIKLHPASQKFEIMSTQATRVYKTAEELGLPISFHTGIHFYRISSYNMLLYDEIAFHYPKLKFSMEHAGGYCFFKECIAVMLNNSKNGNMPYAGLTSVCDHDTNKYWYLSDSQLNDLLWLTGDSHVIFGIDFPYNSCDAIQKAINRFMSLGWSREVLNKLFYKNLVNMIGIN